MKLSKIIEFVLVGIFVSLCFYISIEVVVALKTKNPVRLFTYSLSYVPTESMETEIMAGDYVLFQKVDYEEVNVDDIIVYRSEDSKTYGMYIIHRVIEKNDNYLITKGDNNPLPDEEHITSSMLVGRYVKVLGFMGTINKHKGLLITFVLSLIIVLFGTHLFNVYINGKKVEVSKQDELKKQMLEELKQEILKEELEKIKNSKK